MSPSLCILGVKQSDDPPNRPRRLKQSRLTWPWVFPRWCFCEGDSKWQLPGSSLCISVWEYGDS